jgi:predicted ATPase/DNA-binding SARP family transcriptional activator
LALHADRGSLGATSNHLDFRILGPLEVLRSGNVLPLAGRKQRALLALLLLHANRSVTRETAVEALWNVPPKTADKIVRMYAARLQKLLGSDVLEIGASGFVLHVAADALDTNRFEQLVAEAQNVSANDAALLLRQALSLWRGRALGDIAYEEFARAESVRLEEARLAALEEALAADLAAGRAGRIVAELEALVAAEPLRERARELLMLALYQAGRQAEALEEYQRARVALVHELGIEPGRALKRLQRAILRQEPELDAANAKAIPQLAVPPTPFLGRERELERVAAMLRRPEVRLLTLTGTGGIGKTRLALEVARALADEFTDGVHIVPLGSVADPTLVVPTIAQTLGVLPVGSAAAPALQLHLRARSILLVLDSFEHLVPAAPDLVDLLAAAPGLKMLVTSTAVLHVYSEREFVVPPLELPAPGHDHDADRLLGVPSVALFVRRAEAVNDEFALDESSGPIVAEICRRLDGLPLAIELAAARTKLLPPHAMLERLGHRLQVLGGGARDAPARQQTLRATIDWSFGLLTPDEQRLFARLGVFAGGCTLEAAEAVCGEGTPLIDGIASLLDKSLLRSTGDAPRFSMLDTLREYALERLEHDSAGAQLRRRHAIYFVALADRAEPELTGARQAEWYERLESDHDNFRAALRHTLSVGSGTLALRLSSALPRFWQVRGYAGEGRTWLLAALAESEADAPSWLRAKALVRAGVLSLRHGEYADARPLLEEGAELYARIDDRAGAALATVMLGQAAMIEGDGETALAYLQRGVDAYRELADMRGYAVALNDVGLARLYLGDAAGAARDCVEAAALSSEHGDRQAASMHLLNAGFALSELGRETEAVAKIAESVEISREVGYKEGSAIALLALADIAERRDDDLEAARLLAAADVLCEEIGAMLDPCDRSIHDRIASSVIEALGDEAQANAQAEGRTLDPEQALDSVLRAAASV